MNRERHNLTTHGARPQVRARGAARRAGRAGSPCLAPRGLTLIELLVVIVILVTIVAAAIPIMAPSNSDRQLREATRALNTFITVAQARAIELQRPYGISLKKLSVDTGNAADNGVSLEVRYVEQPLPYTGFDPSSAARIAFYTPANNLYGGIRSLVLIQFVSRGQISPSVNDGLPVGWDADIFPGGAARPGDVVEIQGTRYVLLSDTNDSIIQPRFTDSTQTFFAANTGKADNNAVKATQIVARPLNNSGQMLHMTHDDHGYEIGTAGTSHVPYFTSPAPYKILRQPAPTSAEPYQLPEGTAIDLRASGVGSFDFFHVPGTYDNTGSVTILFAPEGRISRVLYDRRPNSDVPFDEPVADNVYLLVGLRSNIPAPRAADDPTLNQTRFGAAPTDEERQRLKDPINWLGASNRWVVLGPQSGRIVSVENAFVDPLAVIGMEYPFNLAAEQSEEMRNNQIAAAREFTREMANLGGR